MRRYRSRPLLRAALLSIVLFVAACGGAASSPEQARLDRTFDYVVKVLRMINTDPLAAMSFQSLAEMGGTPQDYVAASLPENADMVGIGWEQPGRPWTVVIRDEPGGALRVDGYGAEAGTPVRTETIVLQPAPAPR